MCFIYQTFLFHDSLRLQSVPFPWDRSGNMKQCRSLGLNKNTCIHNLKNHLSMASEGHLFILRNWKICNNLS